MLHQWVTQGMKRSIDNAQRPGRGSMMRPTINEESDCPRKKNLQWRSHGRGGLVPPTLLQNHLRDMFKSVEKRGGGAWGNTDPIFS